MVDYAFCVDSPTWPGCDEVLANHAATAEMAGGDMHPEWEVDPMMGQLVYTTVALMGAARAGLTLFAWDRLIEDPYDSSVACAFGYDSNIECTYTNWVEIYDKVANYSMLAFFGVAAVTQIATLFGALAEINLMVWMYGGMAYAASALVVELLILVSMNATYNGYDKEEGYFVTKL